MKKLSAGQITTRDKHAEDIRNAQTELNEVIEKYNAVLEEHKANIETALTAFNEKLTAAREWRDEIVSDIDSYVGDRSEKWQESDAASAYEEWKSAYENLEMDDVEIDELPEPLDLIEVSTPDDLEALETAPER
jgi:chromosome segregation ATPase